jgi:hypothetical protein
MLFSTILIYSAEIDPQSGSNIGFALIGAILFNIFVNVLLFLYTNLKLINAKIIKPLVQKCRKYKE